MKIVLTNKNNEILNPETKKVLLYEGEPITLKNTNYKYDYITNMYSLNIIDTNIDLNLYSLYIKSVGLNRIEYSCIDGIVEKIQQDKPVGYKALDKDMCATMGNGMKYELNKEYHESNIRSCIRGFHFALEFEDAVFAYDSFSDIRIFRVKVPKGSIIELSYTKICSSGIILTEEVNPEQFIKDNDLFKDIDNYSNVFKFSEEFLEYIVDNYTEQASAVLENQYINHNIINDKLTEKLESKLIDDIYKNNLLSLYSGEKAIKLVKERNITDLGLLNTDTIEALPFSYFIENGDKLTNIRLLYPIITLDICREYFDSDLIQRYIKNGCLDDKLFKSLIEEKFEYFKDNISILNEYIHYIIYLPRDMFLKVISESKLDHLYRMRLVNTIIDDFELFKICFNKSNMNIGDFTSIIIRDDKQLKFIIKQCGNNYNMILKILYRIRKDNYNCFSLSKSYYNEYKMVEYFIKKYTKLYNRKRYNLRFNKKYWNKLKKHSRKNRLMGILNKNSRYGVRCPIILKETK